MRVCVTGGAGYIGSHLVSALHQEGHEVIVVDNLENGMKIHPNCRFFSHDVREIDQMEDKLQGTEVFFHLAANKNATSKDYYEMVSANVGGTTAVLEIAKRVGARRLVFSSSAAVYSEKVCSGGFAFESGSVQGQPQNIYGVSKLLAESVCNFMNDANFSTICLRYFNVWGGEYSKNHSPTAVRSAIENFVLRMETSQPINIYGNGTSVRDYVHVDDVVDANLLAMSHVKNSDGDNCFNVCTGTKTSVLELAQLVCGKDYPVVSLPERENELKCSVGASTLSEVRLRFKAKRNIQELSTVHT